MTTSASLREALTKLEHTFIPCVIKRDPEYQYTDWYELLCDVTKTVRLTTAISDSMRIAEFWLAHFDAVVVSCNVTGLYVKDMDRFIKFTLDNNLVEILTAQKGHSDVLAWLCVARASLVEYTADLPDGGTALTQLLERWLNRRVTSGTLSSMHGMIDYIYGPAVWVLYNTEVEYLSTLPQHLYTLRLPVSTGNTQLTNTIALPNNFSHLDK